MQPLPQYRPLTARRFQELAEIIAANEFPGAAILELTNAPRRGDVSYSNRRGRGISFRQRPRAAPRRAAARRKRDPLASLVGDDWARGFRSMSMRFAPPQVPAAMGFGLVGNAARGFSGQMAGAMQGIGAINAGNARRAGQAADRNAIITAMNAIIG